MENIIKSITQSLVCNNPYAALCVSLTLPDIAAAYEYPSLAGVGNVGQRYRKWFKHHLAAAYTREVGADHTTHVFMNAADFYAMRCAVLHKGKDDISTNNYAELSKFNFVTLPNGSIVHCNSEDNGSGIRLNIQVEILCDQIMKEVQKWWSNLQQNERDNIDNSLIAIKWL